jgi:hypothetical protein
MATIQSTTPKSRKSAAAPVLTRVDTPDCYDPLVSEIATLECVLATLVAWDLSDGEKPSIGSAELVLRQSIERMHDIVHDVLTIQEVAHG